MNGVHSGRGAKPSGWRAPSLSWHRLNRGWGSVGVAEGPGRVLPACTGGPAEGKACLSCGPGASHRTGSASWMWLELGHLLADRGPLTSCLSLHVSPLPRPLATSAPPLCAPDNL